MKTVKHSFLIMIFCKQTLYNPTPQCGLLAMSPYNSIELVNEQPAEKCLTLSYDEK